MFIPERHKLTWQRYKLYVVCTFVALTYITLQYSTVKKVPFPTVPDVPAHIPFQKQATWEPETNRTAFSKEGMVASDSEVCSSMGAEILRKGGNAADAAVITCLCIGGTHTMLSSGIGGGAFITSKLINEPNAISIDAREMAPRAAYAEMFEDKEHRSQYGGLASGIPGELMGLWKLHQLHGSGEIEWRDLVLPVAELMEKGWEVNQLFAFALKTQLPAFKYFRKDWDFVFKGKGYQLLEAGDTIKRTAFAQTLRYIAEHGATAFYDSQDYIARSLSAKIQEWEGIITPEDFDMYDVIVEDALKLDNFTSNNYTVYAANGASSGLALISGLSIIDALGSVSASEHYTEKTTHRMVETMKWMAATRSYLGDIGIHNDNQSQIREREERYNKFLSKDYIDDVLSKIDDEQTHSWDFYNPAYEMNDPHGTSSLSVVDKYGNAVTLTTTVNLLFGSCVHDPVTGVIMNNEMDDFSLPHTKNAFQLSPSVYNYIEPFKRPLSSSAQSIVVDSDGGVKLVIGAAGGSRITTAVFQGIIRTLVENKNITETIAYPRMHHQLIPERVFFETPISEALVESLTSKGHEIEKAKPQSAMNAILVDTEGMWGQSDWWRKFGVAVGV
jgi:gamma-glutamyltranspeptidase / glutathione hydrolase